MPEHFPFFLEFAKALVGFYGGFLFAWWWLVVQRASIVYAIVMVILFGFSYESAVSLYARHLVHNNPCCIHEVAGSTWYILRGGLAFIGVIAVEVAMTARAIRTLRSIRNEKFIDKGGL